MPVRCNELCAEYFYAPNNSELFGYQCDLNDNLGGRRDTDTGYRWRNIA